MPPRTRYSAERIVEAAYVLVQSSGPDVLSARSVAAQLGSSTAPVFHHFSTMEALQTALLDRIIAKLVADMRPHSGEDPLQAAGKAMIRCALEEPRLYEALFLRHHSHHRKWGPVRRGIADQMAGFPRYSKLNDSSRFGLVGRCAIVAHGLGLEVWSKRITGQSVDDLHAILIALTDPIIEAVLDIGTADDIHTLTSKGSLP